MTSKQTTDQAALNAKIETLKAIVNDYGKPIEERREAWREFNRILQPKD